MPKVYFCVLDDECATHTSIVDLNFLPDGADSNDVRPIDQQSADIINWLKSDIKRAAEVTNRIALGQFTSEALFFVSQVASLYENLPPADQEKDFIIAAVDGRAEIVRTSPEVAELTWRRMANFGRPST